MKGNLLGEGPPARQACAVLRRRPCHWSCQESFSCHAAALYCMPAHVTAIHTQNAYYLKITHLGNVFLVCMDAKLFLSA